MFNCVKLTKVEEYFLDYARRPVKGVYFGRLPVFNEEIKKFLTQYLEETRKCGVYIKGKLANPDERQLGYFEEIIGLEFKMNQDFFKGIIKKWLPRLAELERSYTAEALFGILSEMQSEGKNENILKNAYIKFMCWFYYKFERILNQIGKEKLPKILYEGSISNYELKMLSILAHAGCDILLVEPEGDSSYLKVDPASSCSFLLPCFPANPFPAGFSVSQLPIGQNNTGTGQVRPVTQNVQQGSPPRAANTTPAPLNGSLPRPAASGVSGNTPPVPRVVLPTRFVIPQPDGTISTNTWLSGDVFTDCLKDYAARGDNPAYYYNMFVRVIGVEDKGTYRNELLKWKLKLDSTSRKVIITEKLIEIPNALEIQKIKRGNYTTFEQLVVDLSANIDIPRCRELEKLAKKALIELLQEEKEAALQKLTNRAVCLLCWLNRYISELFSDWKLKSSPVFVYYGVCSNENETALLRLLSRMPIDVFIICPDLSLQDKVNDRFLFEKKYNDSMEAGQFPKQVEDVQFGTVAFHAEQDLNTIIYQDSGLYRNRQFKKAVSVRLQTTYEEIGILWDQEAKYRPNFEVLDDKVMVPVIFSKVSGVPGTDQQAFWDMIVKMMGDDTFVVSKIPFITSSEPNPMKQHVPGFLKNGKLQAEKIRSHPAYQYAFMREEMQDYIFDKIQQLLDSKQIAGTFSQGAEFTILAVALNLNKQIIRMIQKFDFTKAVPKLIMIGTSEEMCSLEDSILAALLSLIGFDVVLFTPTGYQGAERFYTQNLLIEHQAGDYRYDLRVPDLNALYKNLHRESLASKLFRRRK